MNHELHLTLCDIPNEQAAIVLRKVSFSYEPGHPVIDRISLAIPIGARVGVLGPNGGGKSTMLKLILGLLKPDQGEVLVLGKSPRQARQQRLVGYLPQRLDAQWHAPLTVKQVVGMTASLSLKPWQRMPRDMAERIEHMIELVGMKDLAQRPIGELSGGQQQRTFIAQALAARPQLLLLDEPTVGIDQAGQEQFAKLLESIHRELSITILIVSHDLRAIAAGCDHIAVLSRTLHYHAAPEGLTPEVLAEVFHHDIAAFAHAKHPCEGEHA
jgi:zinc transport system ATP-binding protein